MLNNRLFISYVITTIFYLALVGIIVYIPEATKIATETSQEKVIQMSVTDFMPEVLPVEEVEEKVEEPKEEEKKVEEVVLLPVVETKVVEKPKPKKKTQKKKTVKKKIAKKKVVKKKKSARKASAQKRKVNPAKVNRFYREIRMKINKYKSYPKIAKRRRMQGTVNVKFTILASGRVSNISISGPKVFHKSARKAVQRVFPVNVKNIPVSLPTTVNVTLHYTIR